MRTAALTLVLSTLLIFSQAWGHASGQAPIDPPAPVAPVPANAVPGPVAARPAPNQTPSPAVQQLLAFQPSEVKFSLNDLMDVLSDRRHEGWVLAAYPDPKTRQPLIGAGFSLDLPARQHPQSDPLNPHPFLEPSSAELWQAAGLEPGRLDSILRDFRQHLPEWTRKNRRAKINGLAPQISDQDANALVRIGSIQAIENARAYCRNFDRLSASQQMALSQLVYQMGVNLEEFTQFLGLINSNAAFAADTSENAAKTAFVAGNVTDTPPSLDWKEVQLSLIHSQWARLYRTRAVAVIAMLDPHYADGPSVAERRISATLRPAVVRRKGRRSAPATQLASTSRRAAGSAHAKSQTHRKRRA